MSEEQSPVTQNEETSQQESPVPESKELTGKDYHSHTKVIQSMDRLAFEDQIEWHVRHETHPYRVCSYRAIPTVNTTGQQYVRYIAFLELIERRRSIQIKDSEVKWKQETFVLKTYDDDKFHAAAIDRLVNDQGYQVSNSTVLTVEGQGTLDARSDTRLLFITSLTKHEFVEPTE